MVSKTAQKKGRFSVRPSSSTSTTASSSLVSTPKKLPKGNKQRPKVSFAETMTVVTIPKNDCPRDYRPRLKKVNLTEVEQKEDIKHLGRARRKKYKLLCSNPKHTIYSKKSGFKCCSLPKEGGAKKKKRTKK